MVNVNRHDLTGIHAAEGEGNFLFKYVFDTWTYVSP